MRPTPPPPDHLRRLVADGLTVAQIASRWGVAHSTAAEWLRTAGLTVARPGVKQLGAWGSGAGLPMPDRIRPRLDRMGG